jgi:hypothetical protein
MTYKYDEMERTKEMDVSYLTLQYIMCMERENKTYSA